MEDSDRLLPQSKRESTTKTVSIRVSNCNLTSRGIHRILARHSFDLSALSGAGQKSSSNLPENRGKGLKNTP